MLEVGANGFKPLNAEKFEVKAIPTKDLKEAKLQPEPIKDVSTLKMESNNKLGKSQPTFSIYNDSLDPMKNNLGKDLLLNGLRSTTRIVKSLNLEEKVEKPTSVIGIRG